MNIQEALNKYKQNVPKYTLIHGDTEWLREYSKDILLKSIAKYRPDLEFKILGSGTSEGEIINLIGQNSLNCQPQAIILHNTSIFSSQGKSDAADAILASKLAEDNLLIICADGKIDKRKKEVKKLLTDGIVIDCNIKEIQKGNTQKWIMSHITGKGYKISDTDAQYLIEYCGGDLLYAIGELNKIDIVCEGVITKKIINKYMTPSFQYNIFKIHDLLCNKQIEPAVKILNGILADDPKPIGIIKLLYNSFIRMHRIQDYIRDGLKKSIIIDKIMKDMHTNSSWAAENAYTTSFKISAAGIRYGIRKLAEFDFGIKQSKYSIESDLVSKIIEAYLFEAGN